MGYIWPHWLSIAHLESNITRYNTMLDVEQQGEQHTKDDTYRLRTLLHAVHCDMTKKRYNSTVEIGVLLTLFLFNLYKQVHYLWRLN